MLWQTLGQSCSLESTVRLQMVVCICYVCTQVLNEEKYNKERVRVRVNPQKVFIYCLNCTFLLSAELMDPSAEH